MTDRSAALERVAYWARQLQEDYRKEYERGDRPGTQYISEMELHAALVAAEEGEGTERDDWAEDVGGGLRIGTKPLSVIPRPSKRRWRCRWGLHCDHPTRIVKVRRHHYGQQWTCCHCARTRTRG